MNFIAVFKNGQKVRVKNCTSYKISTDQNVPMGYVGVVAELDHVTSCRVFINPAEALYWGAEEQFQDVTPEPKKEEPSAPHFPGEYRAYPCPECKTPIHVWTPEGGDPDV